MGFKVIETEEELRSAHSAGLLWFKGTGDPEYTKEFLTIDDLVPDWRGRAEHPAESKYRWDSYTESKYRWDSYILVEDE